MRQCTWIVVLSLTFALSACGNLPSEVRHGRRVIYQASRSEAVDVAALQEALAQAEAMQDRLHEHSVQVCYPSLMRTVDRDLSEAKQDMAIGFYFDAQRQLLRLQERQAWLAKQGKKGDMSHHCPSKMGAYIKEGFAYDQ